MARHLKPGDRVARPQLDRTIHGEVITYNGELRVLREDTGEMDLTVGWYVLDRDTGCGDATCTTCAAPKLPTPTVGLEAATTLAQLALAGLEQPITVHTLAWRESGAEDPEDAGGELQPGLVVVRGSDEPIRLRLDVDTLRPLSDHAEVLTPIGVTLRPLDVKPDSVIVVSMPKASPVQMLDRFSLFSQALKKRLGDGVLVVGVEQGTSIDVLADQILPLGRAILPQEEVLRLQGRDTRAALLEAALGEWLDARTPGWLPRDTAEWTAHLGRQLDADSTLEREVRRLGVGPGREVVERPERRALPEFVTLPVDPANVVRDLCELLDHAETNFGARPDLDMVAFTLPPALYQRAAQEVAEQSRFGPDPLPGSEWPVARPSEAACYVIRNVDLYQDDDAQEVRLWLAVRGVEQAFPHARWTSRHGSGGFATGGTIPRGTPLPAGFPTLGDPAPSRLSLAQLREMQPSPSSPSARWFVLRKPDTAPDDYYWFDNAEGGVPILGQIATCDGMTIAEKEGQGWTKVGLHSKDGCMYGRGDTYRLSVVGKPQPQRGLKVTGKGGGPTGERMYLVLEDGTLDPEPLEGQGIDYDAFGPWEV